MPARALLVVLGLTYPLWVWWGLRHWGADVVAAGLFALALLRLWVERDPAKRRGALGAAAVAAVLALCAALFDASEALLLYPVFMNGFLLVLFASSLAAGRVPVAERLARLKDPDLPPEGVRWCRGVTRVWCAFFVANSGTALATVILGDPDLWALWNGCLSYVATGLLFTGEFVARTIVMRRKQAS